MEEHTSSEEIGGSWRCTTQEELTEANLSEEEAEKQLSDETTELESIAGWKTNATREENDMGDQDDLPFDVFEEEVQQRRLHKKIQPLEHLDRVIEEIKKLMLRSAEAVNKGKMNKREPAIAVGKKRRSNNSNNNDIAGEEQEDNSKGEFGIQEDFNTGEEELMRGAHDFPSSGV
jgi:hypothetical protein